MPDIDLISISVTVLFMLGLGVILSVVLAIANKRLWVYEDPRIDEVEDLLPKTNCGACGSAGCRPFAELLIAGEISPANCTVSSAENIEEIAEYLGVEAGDVVKRVARLACAGGSHVARLRAHYDGLDSCRAAALIGGGPKSCVWGCIGLGDCEDVCDHNAIKLNKHGLPIVNNDKCTACEDCVDICPKNLFSIQPVTNQLWIACKNQLKDDEAEAVCEVACTGCEKCSVDAAPGLIQISNNLAQVDYSRNHLASIDAIQRCATGAIVWMDKDNNITKGKQAKVIIREEPLPF